MAGATTAGERSAGTSDAPRAAVEWLGPFVDGERRSRRRESRQIWGGRAGVVAVVLGAWQILAATGVSNPQIMSSPSAILSYLVGLLGSGDFYGAVRITFEEVILGLVIGVVVGAGLGLAFALLPRFSEAMQPIIGGVNAVPKIAVAPLAVVWLGLGIGSKVLLAAIGVFFVIFFDVVSGSQELDPALRWNASVLGLSRAGVVRTVLLPYVLVWVVTGLKVSISLALVGAVIGEYVGSNAGLGYEINAAINGLAVTRMFALLLTLAAIGGGLYLLVAAVEKRVLRWR